MKTLGFKFLGVLLLAVMILSTQEAIASASRKTKEDKSLSAPAFSLKTLHGQTCDSQSLEGKKAILFFFTTWCPYCVEKIPMLSKNKSFYQEQGIELLAIDVSESEAKVSSFATKQKIDFDILLDTTGNTSREYGVIGVPTFVLVSKDGNIVYHDNDLPRNYLELLDK